MAALCTHCVSTNAAPCLHTVTAVIVTVLFPGCPLRPAGLWFSHSHIYVTPPMSVGGSVSNTVFSSADTFSSLVLRSLVFYYFFLLFYIHAYQIHICNSFKCGNRCSVALYPLKSLSIHLKKKCHLSSFTQEFHASEMQASPAKTGLTHKDSTEEKIATCERHTCQHTDVKIREIFQRPALGCPTILTSVYTLITFRQKSPLGNHLL